MLARYGVTKIAAVRGKDLDLCFMKEKGPNRAWNFDGIPFKQVMEMAQGGKYREPGSLKRSHLVLIASTAGLRACCF